MSSASSAITDYATEAANLGAVTRQLLAKFETVRSLIAAFNNLLPGALAARNDHAKALADANASILAYAPGGAQAGKTVPQRVLGDISYAVSKKQALDTSEASLKSAHDALAAAVADYNSYLANTYALSQDSLAIYQRAVAAAGALLDEDVAALIALYAPAVSPVVKVGPENNPAGVGFSVTLIYYP